MRKMFGVLIAVSLLITMAVCSSTQTNVVVESKNLMEAVTAAPVLDEAALTDHGTAVTDFGIRLFQESLDLGENTLISPLSVLSALAMTANGADGETLAQMEAVLGLPAEELNGFLHAYMAQLPEGESYQLSLANGIWFKEDPSFTVEESFLQTNADYYGADVYQAPFDKGTCEEINGWVEQKTDGMIQDMLDEIPEDAVMYLVNALAFDAQWETIYEDYQVRDGVFTTENGAEQDIELMHSTEYQYLEDDSAVGFVKYYEDRTYAFVALLPNENVSVEEYVANLTGAHLQEMLASPAEITVYAAIPKFETEYDVEMSEILQTMGMRDAFDWTAADFSKLGSYADLNLCINRVLHKTFIAVGEQGTKAGAATAVEVAAEGAAIPPEDTRTVTLDRPFVYMLIDCENDLPLFIGTMMDVNGTDTSHGHEAAAEPQTVKDPVSGYCGNTVTTIHVGDEAYSFEGSDSVALTDILINLEYDRTKVCKCLPEYTVDTEFGTGYGISLSGYVRCDEGQADLTQEQMELVQEIFERQVG